MARFVFQIFAIAIAVNCFSEAMDPIREFLKLTPDMEHELVDINFANDGLEKRDLRSRYSYGSKLRIRTFGKDIDLWLHPKDSLLISEETPVYFANYSSCAPGGVYIVKDEKGLMKDVANRLYEDPDRLASLIIGNDELGRITFNGRIESENLMVKSLPDSVVKAHAAYRRSTDHVNNEIRDVAYHAVYRGNNTLEKNHPLNFNVSQVREKLGRYKRSVPNTLYPKILLYLDYSNYKEHGNDTIELLITYIVIMNGIDLKYRSLENPNFRFHIGGIVIATDPMGTPFINDFMIDEKYFLGTGAINKSQDFFYEVRDSIPLKTYDIAAVFTRLKMGGSDLGVIGKAWPGTTCRVTERKKKMAATAIITENGFFKGIHIAAHELGHILGVLSHDPVVNYNDCFYENGFIMAPTLHYTANSSMFSDCSLRMFQEQIDYDGYACFYDKPKVTARLFPRLMPGRFISLEQQCKGLDRGAPCNNKDDDICVDVRCIDGFFCEKTGTPALDGTLCSHPNDIQKKYCVFNRCVQV